MNLELEELAQKFVKFRHKRKGGYQYPASLKQEVISYIVKNPKVSLKTISERTGIALSSLFKWSKQLPDSISDLKDEKANNQEFIQVEVDTPSLAQDGGCKSNQQEDLVKMQFVSFVGTEQQALNLMHSFLSLSGADQ